MGVLYGILIAGALTTLVPFLLMVSTGFKGPTDQNDNRLIPAYFRDPAALKEKYLNDKYRGDESWQASSRIGAGADAATIALYRRFLAELPIEYWSVGFQTAPNQVTGKLTVRYQEWLQTRYANIDELNRITTDENLAFATVQPPIENLERRAWIEPPGRKYAEWREFKAGLPTEFRIPVRMERLRQEFLRARFQGQVKLVPPAIAQGATRFEEIRGPLPPDLEAEFRRRGLPVRYKSGAAETKWAAIYRREEGEELRVPEMPIAAEEALVVRENAATIRNEFATRNYRYVLDAFALNGRALLNTAVFCLLAIATQLTVNPLAAYALSRYPIRASGKILIFLLATMAFPAEVAMIPSFLLLKDLGLLNTFAALVLPAAASGYMIFLLKGFFDSLPSELFEAGSLDGAKETTMMFRIALPLSRPVLGYMALLAFMGAYGAFMYAFLVAQDQRMWTIMVTIYQLQTSAPTSVMMAALTLAALPTLIVFLAAQRTIMRGIVLPGER